MSIDDLARWSEVRPAAAPPPWPIQGKCPACGADTRKTIPGAFVLYCADCHEEMSAMTRWNTCELCGDPTEPGTELCMFCELPDSQLAIAANTRSDHENK